MRIKNKLFYIGTETQGEKNMNRLVRALPFLTIVLTLLPRVGIAATIAEELNVLEERRYAALIGADWQALDALLSDDFFYNTGGGALLTKNDFVDLMKSGVAVVRKASREEAGVRQYGEVALLTGVAHVDVTLKGEDKTLHSRYLHVWVKEGESWRLVARQATYLPEKK